MLKEFKEFALKGNIIDMAIGVIIGGAFQKIVSSLVNDIIMPTLAIFTGKVDFSDLVFTVGNSSIKYGSFITIFIAIRTINKLNDKAKENLDKVSHKNKIFKKNKAKDTVEEPTTKVCPFCFSEINIKATRCPHCTSDLTTENSLESEKETIE